MTLLFQQWVCGSFTRSYSYEWRFGTGNEISLIWNYYYRPQTKFAKVMFSQVSASGLRGWGWIVMQTPSLGRHPPGRPPRQTHPLANTPCAMYAGIWSTSGRYTSHWNTFLCWISLTSTEFKTISQNGEDYFLWIIWLFCMVGRSKKNM